MAKRMLLLLTSLIFSCLSPAVLASTGQPVKPVTVGIIVPLQHQAMDEIVAGFKSELTKHYHGPVNVLVKNAQGDPSLQRAIIQSYDSTGVDLVAPIGTSTSQMTMSMVKDKPVVTVAAMMTEKERVQHDPQNVAGVLDEISTEDQINFIHRAYPDIKKITLVHSADDKVFAEVDGVKKAAKANDMTVQALMVQQLPDMYTISQRIDNDSQAVFVLKDSLIVSGIRTLEKEAQKRHIPVISSDQGSVEQGAAFALGVPERQIGVVGAKVAARILNGEAPAHIPLQTMTDYSVFVNITAAKKQGLDVAALKQVAKQDSYAVVKVKNLGA